MSPGIQKVIGPRVSTEEFARHRGRYVVPSLLLVIAAVMLAISFFQPYWKMTLHAPQYPGGLHVKAYLNRLEGDVQEIDGLNHYIGMRPLEEAAQFERATSWISIGVMGLLVLAAVFVHSPWAAVAALPAFLFPAGFLIDLYFWLNHFGQNLDPTAALSSSIKPFTPPVLGEGFVGQFRTVASGDTGFYIACAASGVILVGLFFHRRAYKPLLEQARRERRERGGDRHSGAAVREKVA